MTKKEGLKFILQLIDEREIGTQEELTAALNAEGLNVSQATVSRDINELALIKTVGMSKKTRYSKPVTTVSDIPQNLIDIYKHVTESVVAANNLIVIKTISGNANSVAMVIDKLHIPGILGTVAGDDTLLIIAQTNSDAEKIVKTLKNV